MSHVVNIGFQVWCDLVSIPENLGGVGNRNFVSATGIFDTFFCGVKITSRWYAPSLPPFPHLLFHFYNYHLLSHIVCTMTAFFRYTYRVVNIRDARKLTCLISGWPNMIKTGFRTSGVARLHGIRSGRILDMRLFFHYKKIFWKMMDIQPDPGIS